MYCLNCRVADVKPRRGRIFKKEGKLSNLDPHTIMDKIIYTLEQKSYVCERKDVFLIYCMHIDDLGKDGKTTRLIQWDIEVYKTTNPSWKYGVSFKRISGDKKIFKLLTNEIEIKLDL